jgi:hypothetical protein
MNDLKIKATVEKYAFWLISLSEKYSLVTLPLYMYETEVRV